MKKRPLIALVILLTVLSLSGCGVFTIARKIGEGIGSGEDEASVPPSWDGDGSEQASPEPEALPTPEPEDLAGTDDPQNESGLPTEEDKALTESFVYGKHKLFRTEDWKEAEIALLDHEVIRYGGASGGLYFTVVEGNTQRGSEAEYMIYAVDEEGKLIAYTDIPLQDGEYVKSAAAWKGDLYYTTGRWDGDKTVYKTSYYDPEGDGFLEDAALSELEIQIADDPEALLISNGIIQDLSRTGGFYVNNEYDGNIAFLDERGEVLNLYPYQKPESSWTSARVRGSDYVTVEFHKYSDETYENEGILLDVIDVKENKTYHAEFDDSQTEIVDVREGYLYFCETQSEDGGNHPEYRTYYRVLLDGDEISVSGEDSEMLCTVYCAVGIDDSYGYNLDNSGSRYDAFTVQGGKCFYLDYIWPGDVPDWAQGNVHWNEIDLSTMKKKEIKASDEHVLFADYGNTWNYAESKTDEESGIRYYDGYFEYFRFADSVENSEKMNDQLMQIFDGIAQYGESIRDSAKSDLSDILSDPDRKDELSWFTAYNFEYSFNGLTEVGSHYVQLAFSDYEYMGGAHGYPGLFHYMFDLDTGEIKEITDFYTGTEEEFKKIVADETMKAWMNDTDYTYGFYNSYEDVKDDSQMVNSTYESFAESASFNMLYSFGRDGLTVSYYPYDLGPYASGFISILIPYERLGIEFD